MTDNSGQCVLYETESWDLHELIASYVCRKVQAVANTFRESQRSPQQWHMSLALTCSDFQGREAPRTVFKSSVYVIFNEEDIVQTAVDCIEDLRAQILEFGTEFDQMEPPRSMSSQ